MPGFRWFALAMGIAFCTGRGTEVCFADVYASQLRITNPDGSPFDGNLADGTGVLLHFTLNDTASAVAVRVKNAATGLVIQTLNAGSLGRGPHSVLWDGTGAVAGQRYLFEVMAEQPNHSNSEWTVFFDSGDIDIFTRGVEVLSDPRSPRFGLIYASNDGGPLGTGITIYNPDGTFHDPFLVAADRSSGGPVDWGVIGPLHATLDSLGRIYASANDKGQVIRVDTDYTARPILGGLTSPKGIFVTGRGEDLTVYVAADTFIFRAKIGTADTFTAKLDTVGAFRGLYPRHLVLDDEGFLYASFRAANTLGAAGAGIRKFDISGPLPVHARDALWLLPPEWTFIPVELAIDYGADRTTNLDDKLFWTTRAGDGMPQDGIWTVDDINNVFPDTDRVITEDRLYPNDPDFNVSFNTSLAIDPVGNIVYMENANEHVFFIAPPRPGLTNSHLTASPDTVLVIQAPTGVQSVRGGETPGGFRLSQNYPNPFNPVTTIVYRLAKPSRVTLEIYNSLGQRVRMLVNETQTSGEHLVRWDGRDDAGQAVTSGMYVYRLKAGDFLESRPMILQR